MKVRDARQEFDRLTLSERMIVRRREKAVLELDQLARDGRAEGFGSHAIYKTYAALLREKGWNVSVRTLYNWRVGYSFVGRGGIIDLRWLRGRVRRRKPSRFISYLLYCWDDEYAAAAWGATPRTRFRNALWSAYRLAERSGWNVCTPAEAKRWFVRYRPAAFAKGSGATPVTNPPR